MEISLVFPHQLFDKHPALDKTRLTVLIEDSLAFGDPHVGVEFHAKKLLMFRAAIQAYAKRLQDRGMDVQWIPWQKGKTTPDMLEKTFPKVRRVHLCLVDDFLLEKRLKRWAQEQNVELIWYESPLFLTPRDWADQFFQGRKRVIMADFYKAQRRRMNILVDGHGDPEGGQWSFDVENRKRLPNGHSVPDSPFEGDEQKNPDIAKIARTIASDFPNAWGSTDGFTFPTTHEAARDWLQDFLKHRLAGFGDYEDAIHTQHRVLYHSAITPMLNIGLLTPAQVVEETLAHVKSHPVPLNSLEGFLRQVIGWREFMREMYLRHGVAMRTRNFWMFHRPMPSAFYTANTGIPPIDETIRRVLDDGWCHHIERLMVLGAFFLLCRIHPDAVYRWFMEMFVDAHDWVMVPNVYGMSQFADGGIFTTKPYLCGSNYILKMSDWKKGPWCDVWDALYWTFIADHRAVFAANHRLSMMAKVVAKMNPEKLANYRRISESFLEKLR